MKRGESWDSYFFKPYIYFQQSCIYNKNNPLEFIYIYIYMNKDVYRHYIEKNKNNGCLPERFESWEFNFWWREVRVENWDTLFFLKKKL